MIYNIQINQLYIYEEGNAFRTFIRPQIVYITQDTFKNHDEPRVCLHSDICLMGELTGKALKH